MTLDNSTKGDRATFHNIATACLYQARRLSWRRGEGLNPLSWGCEVVQEFSSLSPLLTFLFLLSSSSHQRTPWSCCSLMIASLLISSMTPSSSPRAFHLHHQGWCMWDWPSGRPASPSNPHSSSWNIPTQGFLPSTHPPSGASPWIKKSITEEQSLMRFWLKMILTSPCQVWQQCLEQDLQACSIQPSPHHPHHSPP